MAVHASAFKHVGAFDTRLGPMGNVCLKGEDTEMVERLLKAGKRVVYTPHAVVHHKVPPERMRKAYFRRWKFHAGRSLARFSGSHAGRLPRWAVRECLESGAKALGAYLCLRRDRYAKELAFLVRFGRVIGSLERP